MSLKMSSSSQSLSHHKAHRKLMIMIRTFSLLPKWPKIDDLYEEEKCDQIFRCAWSTRYFWNKSKFQETVSHRFKFQKKIFRNFLHFFLLMSRQTLTMTSQKLFFDENDFVANGNQTVHSLVPVSRDERCTEIQQCYPNYLEIIINIGLDQLVLIFNNKIT